MRTLNSDDQASLGGLYSCLKEDAADDVSRARLRRRVLERLETGAGAARRWHFALGTAAAAALVAAFGLVIFHSGPENADPTLKIQANGGVHLEWSDVGKGQYEVLKSTSPGDFSGARRLRVKGTVYVDREPAEAPVVYYRVK